MEALKSINPKTARQALVVWVLTCLLVAFFIHSTISVLMVSRYGCICVC